MEDDGGDETEGNEGYSDEEEESESTAEQHLPEDLGPVLGK